MTDDDHLRQNEDFYDYKTLQYSIIVFYAKKRVTCIYYINYLMLYMYIHYQMLNMQHNIYQIFLKCGFIPNQHTSISAIF